MTVLYQPSETKKRYARRNRDTDNPSVPPIRPSSELNFAHPGASENKVVPKGPPWVFT
ncbi:hypothetical protein N658DRAFT_491342 [Parathielavia hyrcaniae]|uniref:Uncharacterized protein n=1 Tax=Parathielavia hyrcaniae TaxID=113614 RepID=A0AAN6QAQ0_9PEZI|nr:hypothetical protein N658DRAFT_491342 [Parathielavia hyrcaniae]